MLRYEIMMSRLELYVVVGLLVAGSVSAVHFKNVQCDSHQNKVKMCNIGLPGNPPIDAIVVARKDSSAPCRLDRDYGVQGHYIWVDNGCRALFNVIACKRSTTIGCDSRNSEFNTCDVFRTNRVDHVILKSQRSNAACEFGSSYGIDGGSIWVNKGCRGVFLSCH